LVEGRQSAAELSEGLGNTHFFPRAGWGIIDLGVAENARGRERTGPMNFFLEPVNGKGQTIPIDKAIIFIGRHPDCDVVITRSRMISRKHCAIVQVNNTLVLRDLGSTNGVRINGHKVRAEGRFRAGDRVTVGDLEYFVKALKAREPERRARRDHPQDAEAAGAIPLQLDVPRARHDYKEEYSSTESSDSDDDEGIGSDTPESFPLLPDRNRRPPDREKHPDSEHREEYVEDDSHIPMAD
jgi:pSer/pThr/pTyr-binding forkhead associated (FHA) protein